MASLATMEEQQAAEAAGRQPLPSDVGWGWVPLEKRVSIAGLAPAGPRPGSGGGSRPSSSMAAGVSAIDPDDHTFLSPGGSMAAGSASLLAHPTRAILHRSQFA
jgi:hypothetical protein